MTNQAKIRHAHRIIEDIIGGYEPTLNDIKILRSCLPEPPKQKTLQEIIAHVNDAWAGAGGNDWGGNSYDSEVTLEDWLTELHAQLKGIAPAKPAHPEFLETEADYAAAPEGTIVACDDSPPWYKFDSVWISTINCGSNSAESMSGIIREVLRWGWGE